MPRYDKKCKECGTVWEVSHPINENPVYTCPSCESTNNFNLMSPTRTIFKGGGWAAKDAAYDRMGVPQHVRKHADERL